MKVYILIIFILLTFSILPQGRWQKLNGPVGGSFFALAAKGDTIIGGTGNFKGMFFYSFDGGKRWHQSNIKLNNRITSFIISEDYVIAIASTNGIYRSLDFINWQKVYQHNSYLHRAIKDYNNNLYTANDLGQIFKSNNGGVSWELNFTTTGGTSTFVLGKDSTLYLSGTKKILKKRKDNPWETIDLSTYFTGNPLCYVAVDENNNLYAGTSQVIFSTDGGETWDIKTATLQGEYLYDFEYNGRLIGAFGDESGWFGNNYGAAFLNENNTWQWSNTGLPPKFAVALRLAKSGTNTYLGTNAAGVFKSTDFGESWFPINNGITAANVLDICFDNEGTIYTANWSNGFQKSTDNGKTWSVINNGLTNSYCYSIIADDNGFLIGGTDQGSFRSTDKGASWHQITIPGNDYAYYLRKDRKNRIYALTYGTGLYRTSDLGNSWVKLDDGWISGYVFGFLIDDEENIYAGTRRGAIYKSTDDGNSWSEVYRSTNQNAVVNRISISPKGYIFATCSNEGILRSKDGGSSWTLINNGITFQNTRSLGITQNGEIFVGYAAGKIYYSQDHGESWQDYTSNLDLVVVRHFLFDKDDNLYLATDESVWRINPDSVTTIVKSEDKVYQFALMQNYPNPFNPVTKIKYAVPSSLSSQERTGVRSFVTLKVYDIIGKEVTVLVNKEQEAGEYEVEWNASNIPSGVYFYTLRAGELAQTRKLVLLR
jgi:photosystem II stability/assembly factor-like uncharacterized protein